MRCHYCCKSVATRLAWDDNVAVLSCAFCSVTKSRELLWTGLTEWRKK